MGHVFLFVYFTENGILTMDDFISIAGPKLQPEEEMEDNLEEAFKVFDRLGTG